MVVPQGVLHHAGLGRVSGRVQAGEACMIIDVGPGATRVPGTRHAIFWVDDGIEERGHER